MFEIVFWTEKTWTKHHNTLSKFVDAAGYSLDKCRLFCGAGPPAGRYRPGSLSSQVQRLPPVLERPSLGRKTWSRMNPFHKVSFKFPQPECQSWAPATFFQVR